MDREAFVYKITEIIFKHFGQYGTDSVKQCVRELVKTIEPQKELLEGSSEREDKDTAIITVFGESKPGIVAGITSVLAENNVDITDIAQTLLGKNFAMIIIVDLSLCSKNFTELKEVLIKKGEELGVAVFSQHKELFKSMHRI
ncbi:ACT domain-containing protein [Thermotomaculum hydrothermale]|uniref:UPF0237 protein TTHT_1725 n=1 Tax=Thermotomaculum hydrothermale TaxID=981385 RepID=A0A7R6SZY2_9BACT|nr:ACT domain-containing protein [Thermotomaculum hydrothermale]BBB33197.1 ACT domain-containing protein [Thermotomaculum hydrothermale]